jgi:putative MATE family efflux protein
MQRKKKHILADKNITKLIIKLSAPATIGMLVMALYNIVDAIFVGHGVGTHGLAGISIVFPFQMLVLSIGSLIGIGGASIISRCLGSNNLEKANRTLGNVYSLVIVFGILLAVGGSLFINPLLKLFGVTKAIFPFSKDYLQIILFGIVFFLFLIASNNIIRSEGKAKIAMGTMIVSAILNIILDPIFIFVLKMGTRGVAIATVLSQAAAVCYIIFYFSSKRSSLHFKIKNLKYKLSIVREIFSIGISAFVRLAAGSVIIIILYNTLATYGVLPIAVFGVIHRLLRFTIMPTYGIAQGLQPIIGYNYGAREYRNILKAIKTGIILATSISFIGFLILISFPESLMKIFTKDVNLISTGSSSLRLIILALPFVGFQVVGATTFQAIGKAVPAFLLSSSRQILFLIPLILILPKFFHLTGVWIAFPIADLLSFIVTFFFLNNQINKFKLKIRNE